MSDDEESRWSIWMRNGRLAAIGWLLVLCINVGFRIAEISAPSIDQLLTAMTGLLIGNLTITIKQKASSKKSGDDASDAVAK